jgi:hypothetical protein
MRRGSGLPREEQNAHSLKRLRLPFHLFTPRPRTRRDAPLHFFRSAPSSHAVVPTGRCAWFIRFFVDLVAALPWRWGGVPRALSFSSRVDPRPCCHRRSRLALRRQAWTRRRGARRRGDEETKGQGGEGMTRPSRAARRPDADHPWRDDRPAPRSALPEHRGFIPPLEIGCAKKMSS